MVAGDGSRMAAEFDGLLGRGIRRSVLNRMKRLKLAQVTGNSEPENNCGRSRTVLPVIWFFVPPAASKANPTVEASFFRKFSWQCVGGGLSWRCQNARPQSPCPGCKASQQNLRTARLYPIHHPWKSQLGL